MLRIFLSSFIILGISLIIPHVSFASLPAQAGVIISEIMYDLPGSDTGREWIEVQNTGTEEVSFLKWKLFEAGTNHGLRLFQGTATTSASGFAIIADDPKKFLMDNPHYSGTLFGSSFSLSNTGETLELKFGDKSMHRALYASSMGATGDGNSLHYVSNNFQAGIPSPGSPTYNYKENSVVSEPLSTKEEKPIVAVPVVTKAVKSVQPIAAPIAKPARKESIQMSPAASSTSSANLQDARQEGASAQSGELLGAAFTSDGGTRWPWLLGVALLLLVSIGGYLAILRPKPEPTASEELRKEAARYDIIEDS